MKKIKRDITNKCYIPMYVSTECDLFRFCSVQILQ